MFVPSRLKSSVVGGYVTGTDQIIDDTLGKSQAEINAGIEETVTNKVEDAIRESTAAGGTIDSKIDEKVPEAVRQAVNNTVMPAVQEMIDSISQQEDTNTTYKLSVNGSINGDVDGVDLGAVYAPVTSGTSGQILASSGEGNAPQWINPSANGGLTEEQVTELINQEIYGTSEKPQGVEAVNTEGLAETLSDYMRTDDIAEWAKAGTKPSYDYSELQNTPSSLPASDVSDWAKASSKPSYDYSEITNTPNALPASDVPAWAKNADKPGYNYGEIGYTISKVSSEGGAVTVDASVPVHEITATGSISGITFANNSVPEDGHSCHIIIKAEEVLSVSIADDATMAVENEGEENEVLYKSVCPKSTDIALNITAGGYVEFDLFRIGENIYVRGI